MAKTLQFRRASTAGLASVTGAEGEIFIDTTKDTVVVMDGSTAGGFPLAKESTVTAANVGLKGYVDSTVTAANVGLKGYVDSTVTAANVGMKGYVDSVAGGGSYSNVQVATYLPTYSGNIANIRLGVGGVLTFADGTTQTTGGGGGSVEGYTYANVAPTVYTSAYMLDGQGALSTSTVRNYLAGIVGYDYSYSSTDTGYIYLEQNYTLTPAEVYLKLSKVNLSAEFEAWFTGLVAGDTFKYITYMSTSTPSSQTLSDGWGGYLVPITVNVTVVQTATLVPDTPFDYYKLPIIMDAEPFDTFTRTDTSVVSLAGGFNNGYYGLNQLIGSVIVGSGYSELTIGKPDTTLIKAVTGAEFDVTSATLGNLYLTDNVITAIPSPDYYGTGFVENPVVVNSALEVLGAEEIVSTTFTNLTGPDSGGVRIAAVLYPVADPGVSYLQIYLQGRFGTTLALNDTVARNLENAVHSLKAGSTIDLVGYNGIWTGTATVTVSGDHAITYIGNNGGSPYVSIPLVERATGGSSTNYSVNDITFNVDTRTPSTVDTVTTFTNDVTFEKYITADRVTTDNMVTKVSSKSLHVISPNAEALRIELDKWDNYYLPSSDTITNLYFIMQPQDWATDGTYYPLFGFLNGGYKEVTIMYDGQLPTTHYWNDTTIGISWQNNTPPSETGRKLVTYRIYQGPLGGAGTWNPQIFGTYVDFS